MSDDAGKVALITGAARGIGLATAELMAQMGWRVALLDRDAEALKEAVAGIDGALALDVDGSNRKRHPKRSVLALIILVSWMRW